MSAYSRARAAVDSSSSNSMACEHPLVRPTGTGCPYCENQRLRDLIHMAENAEQTADRNRASAIAENSRFRAVLIEIARNAPDYLAADLARAALDGTSDNASPGLCPGHWMSGGVPRSDCPECQGTLVPPDETAACRHEYAKPVNVISAPVLNEPLRWKCLQCGADVTPEKPHG